MLKARFVSLWHPLALLLFSWRVAEQLTQPFVSHWLSMIHPPATSHDVLTFILFSNKLLLSSGMRFQCSTNMSLKLLIELFRIFWVKTLPLVASLCSLVVISDKPYLSFLMVFNNSLFQHPLEEAISGIMSTSGKASCDIRSRLIYIGQIGLGSLGRSHRSCVRYIRTY